MSTPETEGPSTKCRVEMHDGTPCGREAWDHLGICMWHSKNSGKDRNVFRQEIEAMLARKDYDFTGFVFEEHTSFAGKAFEGPVWFEGAEFRGGASFGGAVFQCRASFVNATFGGRALFSAATFRDAAHFVSASFGGEASFYGATFERSAYFGGARFEHRALFVYVRFRGKGQFAQAQFRGGAEFVEATFKDTAGFVGTRFAEEGHFMGTGFQGPALFVQALFEGAAYFVGDDNDGVFSSEADAQFQYARFEQPERVVFHRVFLGRGRFLGADVRGLDFTDVEWARRSLWGPRWQQFIERQDWLGRAIEWLCNKWPARLKPRGRFAVRDELAPERGPEAHALLGQLYRRLKHNYEEQRDPITAGDFHFGEMHMRRLSYPPKNAFWRFLKRNLSFLALYRWISGYGEDYVRPVLWIVGVILLFATAFTLVPALALHTTAAPWPPQLVDGWWPRLLHSVMCFLLRGGRPFQPVHLVGHYVSVAEGIIGPPLIAMLVLALNRRFKR